MRSLVGFLLIALAVTACSTPQPTATAVPTPTALTSTSSSGQAKQWLRPPATTIDTSRTYKALIHTSKGNILVELLDADAPNTVNNFVFLAKEGFYDNVVFHRIVKGFMIQGGDPTGTGAGGPGYEFADEPVKRPYTRGIVAMANAGPNTNGSQFFIMHQDYALPPNYTIFGKVEFGLDVLDKIADTPTTFSGSGVQREKSKPLERVFIANIEITES